MSSSWLLSKRKDIGIGRAIGNKGEYNDSYITPGGTRECHPDYVATPINDPKGYGFLLCTRRANPPHNNPQPPPHPQPDEGVHLHQRDLYTLQKDPRQLFCPYSVQQRTVPNEWYLRQHDYYSRDLWYDGIGVRSAPQPEEFHKFKFDINHPPPKFDVHQLHQRYPVWKKELVKSGMASVEQLDEHDKNYKYTIGSSVW